MGLGIDAFPIGSGARRPVNGATGQGQGPDQRAGPWGKGTSAEPEGRNLGHGAMGWTVVRDVAALTGK